MYSLSVCLLDGAGDNNKSVQVSQGTNYGKLYATDAIITWPVAE